MPFARSLQRYPQTFFLFCCVLVTLIFSFTSWFELLVLFVHRLGYLGILLSGFLFCSAFTATAGALLLVKFTDVYSPLEVALIGTLGAVLMDSLIFHIVSSQLQKELKTAYRRHIKKRKTLNSALRSSMVRLMLPVVGALIIMSPFPDELGVGFLGVSKLHPLAFFCLIFFLNFLGIVTLLGAVGLFV